MLPRAHRLRRPREFREAVRSGARAGTATLVAHATSSNDPLDVPPQIGFIVPKSVGPAVVRNRVRRRLRHLCAARVSQLPSGTTLVIRVLPPAATAVHDLLEADLDSATARALGRAGVRAAAVEAP